jgi:hypothetical protein
MKPFGKNVTLAPRVGALCVVLGLLCAACGGGSEATASPTASPSTATPTAPATTATVTPLVTETGNAIDLATTPPLMVAYGAGKGDFPSDQPGIAVADFNGDGLDDVANGARFADPNGLEDAGAAYVIFGSPNPPATVDFAAGQQSITIYGPDAGAGLGYNAATGDLNGDGAADLAISAPFSTIDGAKRGRVFVFFGPLQNKTIDLSRESADVTLSGKTANGFFGDSLATGDVNGDGVTDLLAGSTFGAMDSPGAPQTGAVYVYFGRGAWPQQLSATDAGTSLFAADALDELGDFTISADINGDGISDVIATAEAADGPQNDRSIAAEVHVLYGRHNFQKIYAPGEEDLIVYGAHTNDTLGFSLAAGDLNGDGTADLAMSAHLADGPGVTRIGAVYVLYGRDDLPKQLDMASPPDYVARIEGATAGDLLATSMTIADVNADGKNELILGGSFVNTLGRSDNGAIFILDASDLSGTMPVGGSEQIERFDGSASDDRLGSNVATGDFTGNGQTEIFAIAEQAAGPTPDRPQAGRVYVLKP